MVFFIHYFNHYLFSIHLLSIRLPRGLVSIHTTRGAKCLCTLSLYQSVLVLSQPSDVSDLVPSRLVLIILLSPTCFRCITICLSQVYGCSDCYNVTFELNALLDLSGGAATKTLSSLMMELLLQILSQSTRAMTVWVIRGDEGVGDIPGV